MEINIYCDESSHLPNDHQKVMGLGATWIKNEYLKNTCDEIRNIKELHGLKRNFEIKWTKVSPGKIDFYKDIIKYFFFNKNLHYRGIIIPDKSIIDHNLFNQTHDDWYYKMFFRLLKHIFLPRKYKYNIYFDIKDIYGSKKQKKLMEVLCNSLYDFSRTIINKIQNIRSHETEIIQITDLLTGAIIYYNRKEYNSQAKLEIANFIKELSGYKLTQSTLLNERKFNLFFWNPNNSNN